jgi:glucan endo-1,3-beta-D-glucosidase
MPPNSSNANICHTTWTGFDNSSNNGLIAACDFLGMDAYPYYQSTMDNGIENAASLFDQALQTTQSVSQGKPVWITETGWPLAGPQENQAVANTANAQTYWQQVGCPLFGNTNTWWYTLFDGTPSPTFGIVGSSLSSTPQFDLSCS